MLYFRYTRTMYLKMPCGVCIPQQRAVSEQRTRAISNNNTTIAIASNTETLMRQREHIHSTLPSTQTHTHAHIPYSDISSSVVQRTACMLTLRCGGSSVLCRCVLLCLSSCVRLRVRAPSLVRSSCCLGLVVAADGGVVERVHNAYTYHSMHILYMFAVQTFVNSGRVAHALV